MDNALTNRQQFFFSALFDDRQHAEAAYSDLLKMGYDPGQINLAMTSTTKDKWYAAEKQIESSSKEEKGHYDGTADGSIAGGLIGGIAFAIGALGSNLLIPGLGLVLMGPVAAGILGAGAGGLTGGFIGKTLSPETPAEQSDLFKLGLKDGKVILALVPHNEHDVAVITSNWTELNAEIIYTPTPKDQNNDRK